MEYFLHIKSNYDCIIQIEKIKKELKDGIISTFLVNTTSNLVATVYPLMPLDCNSSTYSFVILNNDNLEITNGPMKLIKFDEKNYLLLLSPYFIKLDNAPTKTLNFNNHKVFYTTSPISICIEKNDKSISFSNNLEVKNLQYKEKNNNIILYGKTTNNKYFFSHLIFENEYKLIFNDEIDFLNEQNNEIKTYKILNDFSKHGLEVTYSFSKTFSKDTRLVYDNDKPFLTNKKEIIPFAFFEAIKIKNYKLAKHYLSERLAKKLDEKHISSFFENFEFCHQTLSKDYNSNEIALIYKSTPSSYLAKILLIDFDKDNKISNISFK